MYQGLSQELARVMPAALETGLFATTLCTVQLPSGIIGPSGAPDGTWVSSRPDLGIDLSNVIGVECMSAPPSSARIQATDVKSLEEIMNLGLRHVLLSGYFPQIVPATAAGARAVMTTTDANGVVVDTTAYDILGAEADSQIQMTRIELKFASI